LLIGFYIKQSYICVNIIFRMSKREVKRKHFLLFIAGGLAVILFLSLFNKTIQYTSSNEYCASCHVHPHAEASWKLSVHNNTSSGISVKCVECHLPPKEETFRYITRKAYHGINDLYVYYTKDIEKIDWAEKRTREVSAGFVYEEGCKKCHSKPKPSDWTPPLSDATVKNPWR